MLSSPSVDILCPETGLASSNVGWLAVEPVTPLLSTSCPSSPSVMLFRKSNCRLFCL